MHSQVIINPAVTSPAANRSRVYFQADSLITVNFSWIFFPQARETSASQRGSCLCLPKQLMAGAPGGDGRGLRGQACTPSSCLALQKVSCEAAPGCWAPSLLTPPPPPPPVPLVAMGAMVTSGSDLGEGGQGGGGGEEHRWDPVGFCPEVTLAWLRPSKRMASSALLGCDLGRLVCLSVPSGLLVNGCWAGQPRPALGELTRPGTQDSVVFGLQRSSLIRSYEVLCGRCGC